MSKRRLVSGLGGALGLALLTCALAALTPGSAAAYKVPKQCKVPNVVGKRLDRAEAKIARAHCVLGSVSGPADGVVISQDPPAGSAGPTVNLVAAPRSKSKHCTVPEVVGLRLTGALRAITKAHCGVGKITSQSSVVPFGRVVSQSPPPGSPGPSVSLVISSGISHGVRCRVPDLLGMKLFRAKLKLLRAHCAVGRVIKLRSRRHRGRVIDQRPRPGRIEPAGTRVRLIVGPGHRRHHHRRHRH